MIEKTIKIGTQEVRFRSSATVPRLYRTKFKRDIFRDLNKLQKSYKDKGGDFRFRMKAGNGQNIGKSEGYKAKASAKKGIASIAKNAPDAPVIVLDAEK